MSTQITASRDGVPRTRRWVTLMGIVCLLTPGGCVRADDGGISFGGAPRLLKSHPSISMRSELVRMVMDMRYVTVDCQFVFHNAGPATTVRMGFPDIGEGGQDPYTAPAAPDFADEAPLGGKGIRSH